MAGIIPKRTSSGRKQWDKQGSQPNSLKRLTAQLASDGCPDSQLVLAKQLLDEECEYETEQTENARLGVYWLMKASEQGNLEATDLLKSCLKTGKGISEQNYMDVKACISMTQDEKLVRRAAKEVFASLSNGGDYITSNQLQKKILAIENGDTDGKPPESNHIGNGNCGDHLRLDHNGEIANNFPEPQLEREEVDWTQRLEKNNEKLTEDALVSAAVTFSLGNLPVINTLCLSDPNLRALDGIPFVYWSILNPYLTVKIIYFKLIKYLSNKTIPLPLARNDIQLILLFLTYSLLSCSDIALFVPTVLYCVSFIMMIVSTFQLLQTERELHEFRLWRGLFICYSNGDLNEHSFETQFILNHCKQYAWFFFSLLLHYFLYSLSTVKLESEFTVMSFCFMFITLIGFMPKRRSKIVINPSVLFSFAINVLARYPYDTDPIVSRGWRYLELNFPSFPNYVVGNGIEFCINFRLVLYALIPLLLLQLAKKDNWRGSYKTVLPHLVTLSWLQYFALCSHNATMYGLFRGTLALVGSVLFLPLLGLTSVVLPVVAVTRWIVSSNLIYSICLFVILLVICLAVCFMCARTRYAQYTAAVQVLLMVLAFLALIKMNGPNTISNGFSMPSESKRLEWAAFQNLCYKKVWEETENVAVAQARCTELENTQIFWEGTISSVNLLSIENNAKTLLGKLPKFLYEYTSCMIGDELESCDHDNPSQISDCLILQEASSNKCTLKRFNYHTFEIGVKMPSLYWKLSPEVRLYLVDDFKNFTWRLKPNDLIWFKGKMFNNPKNNALIGSLTTYIQVDEIGCITCSDRELSSAKILDNSVFNVQLFDKFSKAAKFVLNVFFNPVLIFK